jgi:hypothetical protein
MIRKHVAWILFVALSSIAAINATELPTPLREEKPELLPVGAATLHWFGLHVYDVALYAKETAYTTNGTAALSIRYNISVKRRKLLDTTLQEWRRLGKGDDAQRKKWIEQLESLWLDLKSGDSLTASRKGDGPTQFYFGDRLLGEVSDPAFGPAFFAIWLDENCSYPRVRDGLLGVKKGGKKGR